MDFIRNAISCAGQWFASKPAVAEINHHAEDLANYLMEASTKAALLSPTLTTVVAEPIMPKTQIKSARASMRAALPKASSVKRPVRKKIPIIAIGAAEGAYAHEGLEQPGSASSCAILSDCSDIEDDDELSASRRNRRVRFVEPHPRRLHADVVLNGLHAVDKQRAVERTVTRDPWTIYAATVATTKRQPCGTLSGLERYCYHMDEYDAW